MFARSVSMHLKAGSVAEFTQTINDEVIPLLRKHKGFLDEIVLAAPSESEAVGISLWDRKESAETYNRDTYPEVQKVLAKVVEGTPAVRTYEVTNSTFHRIAVRAAA
ncbi:MAG TPA: hypothetical protein VMW51_06995 [Terriglobia bacterium]|nr:hypothetical protein [Terriglobia bacterium]